MHISEGVLSAPVLLAGAVTAAIGVAVGLKKMDYDKVAQTAILSAAFFVASLVHVPVLVTNAHLVLNGLLGLLLGWAAVPAILVALTLQAMLFQFGGLTVLGVNTVTMALPAVACYYIYGPLLLKNKRTATVAAFMAGVTGVFLGTFLLGAFLVFTEEGFLTAAEIAVVAHLPIMITEGIITSMVVGFLKTVKPEVIKAPYAA